MPATAVRFTSVTPNLIVKDVGVSTAFYRDLLGFAVKETVPAEPPFVFVWLERGGVTVFVNDAATVAREMPRFAAPTFGGTGTLFVIVEGVDALHDALSSQISIVMSLRTQPYGMREFAVTDPDGHLITFAERVG